LSFEQYSTLEKKQSIMNQQSIKGNIVDIRQKRIYSGELLWAEGQISSIVESAPEPDPSLPYILPGFIDSHVHVESSMLIPSEFARLAVVHGTVATISDPHEIANVCGMEGVRYMIENGKSVPFKFHFGAPSCVPATTFETAGATLDVKAVEDLLDSNDIYYLSEMMNFPGVLHQDSEVMLKIAAAKARNKPVDGHAPGLRGDDARKYIAAGISTDHECFTEEEAFDKLQAGMKILIREGSAARNFEALIGLLKTYPDQMMFCSDDKHPDSLVDGHINELCARAVARGIDLFSILKAACINPVEHYRMNVGTLRPKEPADFILVHDLRDFVVSATYINGELVAANGMSLIKKVQAGTINQFNCKPISAAALAVSANDSNMLQVIEALDGQLITNRLEMRARVENGLVVSDLQNDILKMVVVNRYHPAPPAIAWVKNFSIRKGAIASTVAHDSHNIIAVGVDDESLCRAINLVIREQGGVSVVFPLDENGSSFEERILPLPVAGLMSNEDGYQVATEYTLLSDLVVEDMGSTLSAPFMTLSFMALLVIPHLKLSDKGLFDGDRFAFV
jgi:adenine deaminase